MLADAISSQGDTSQVLLVASSSTEQTAPGDARHDKHAEYVISPYNVDTRTHTMHTEMGTDRFALTTMIFVNSWAGLT